MNGLFNATMHRISRLCPKPVRWCCILLGLCVISFGAGAQSSRPFLMATTAVQMVPLSPVPYKNSHAGFSFAEVAADVDMITLWPEYLGIPYDLFAQGPSIDPSHPWAVKMLQMAADAAATNKPILLELGFVRTGMVAWAYDVDGELAVVDSWAPVCFDFTTPEAAVVADGFVNYAVWMAQTFQPAYLVNFIEANLYYHDCGGQSASWDALVEIQKRAYDAVKLVDSDLPVFPSIKLESLYGHQLNGWREHEYQAVAAMSRDLFGVSVYPFGVFVPEAGRLANPYDLPMDYLVRVMLRHPEEKLAIAETGWNNASISIGDTDQCIQNFPYSEESWVRDYLSFVLGSAHYGQFEFVNWWSMRDSMSHVSQGTCYVRDAIPYPACGSDPWCIVMNYVKDYTFEGSSPLFSELVQKAFGSFGLKTYDGVERTEIISHWRAQRALPIAE